MAVVASASLPVRPAGAVLAAAVVVVLRSLFSVPTASAAAALASRVTNRTSVLVCDSRRLRGSFAAAFLD